MRDVLGFPDRPSLTRISVRGSRDGFVVRHGDSIPVTVHFQHGRLICDCGGDECAHVESIRACGFVDESPGLQQAA
jgi:hypothetical protein